MRTFIAPKPPVPNAVLTATTQGQTSIGLVASYPGIPFAGSYNFEWATSAAGPFTALTPQASAQLAHSGLSAGTTYFYRCRIGFQTGGIGIYSPIVSATTAAIPSSTSIVWNPGVRYTVGKLGAQYGSASQALTDWTTQCTNVANKNASRLVKGFQFCVPLRLLFPLAQGDWGNSLGISLGQQIQTMLNGLANGPYDISLQCNMVANTYGNQLITAATAQGFVPSWWYDNVAYGPVSGG
ncbi:MAG: hypothetical protein JWO52_3344, partial [Gammaproteobacteria bacterium]|nr:hypothetical protein [Gammaproteobacteria bacterium]